jgi:DNA helicase-2/ATP-dependent DNA helicase PcrA
MQWPAVFIPWLPDNRFPATKGGVENEARLFYMATTRAQKYFHVTFSPSDKEFTGSAQHS